jgi:hypothetical protein
MIRLQKDLFPIQCFFFCYRPILALKSPSFLMRSCISLEAFRWFRKRSDTCKQAIGRVMRIPEHSNCV